VSLKTGAYDPAATGVSTVKATSIAVALISAVTSRHVSNRPGGWGASWQSAMWSSYAGRAGWLLWQALPSQLQVSLQNMTIFEANYVATLTPKYSTAASGAIESPGDTGGEEDAWYSLAPALALAMMPGSPQTALWRYKEQQMLIAAWARPSDVTSSALVDGAPLSGWLQGTNVAESGVVANHNRIAPDYSTNLYQSVDTLFMAALAGQPAPQASLQGVSAVYTALSTVSYTTPQFLAPGGQIYSTTTSTIYYPQGCDWGTGQELPYALIDTEANLFGFGDPATSAAAESLHAHAQLAMQARSSNGATFISNTEYNYAGREEHTNQLAAQMYLAYYIKDRTPAGTVSMPQMPSSVIPAGRAPAAQDESIYRR
jgi:hypothetical protein